MKAPSSGFSVIGLVCGACGSGLVGKLKEDATKRQKVFLSERPKNYIKARELLRNPENFEYFWCSAKYCSHSAETHMDYKALTTLPSERKKIDLRILEDQILRAEVELSKLRREREVLLKS